MGNISILLQKILLSKGLTQEQVDTLAEAGITEKSDFETIGDADTLVDVTGIEQNIAHSVMTWAVGGNATTAVATEQGEAANQKPIVIESSDVVRCKHCDAKQPSDYKSGDLCLSCGNQAEPVLTCYWCLKTGPGKYCRSCGGEFVSSADFEVALFLKEEGESKNSIISRMKEMTPIEKDNIWNKIRKQ